MRPLRWKSGYASGDRMIDQRNKRFVGCLNQLMEAAGHREHCQEMEQFLTQLGLELEAYLRTRSDTSHSMIANLYPRMVNALPLAPYGSGACRKCGLCDVAQAKMAEHLRAPLDCLHHPDP